MTDTPKGRHLFALSLIATIYSGPSGHIHNTVGCVMAYSVQDAIGKA